MGIAKTFLKKGIECVPGWRKNYKNMLNLCWRFFATSHGKSVCDGIGGMVNRLSANASL